MAYVFIASNVKFLGFISPESFLRLPGIFKFNDIIFLFIVGIYLIHTLQHGIKFPKHSKPARYIAYLITFFASLVIVQILFTALKFDLPIISTIKVGRGYLYILFYFYLLRFFTTPNDLINLFKFISFMCFIQFIMMLLQISGVDLGTSTIIRELDSNSGGVTRVYIPAYFLTLLTLFISTSLLLSNATPTLRTFLKVAMVISFLSITLSYTRTYWIAMVIGMSIIYLYSERNVKHKIGLYAFVFAVILLPVILLQTDVFIIDRIMSIFNDIGSDEGNFIYRFSENPQRLEAFVDHPIMGPGFVHSSFAATLFNFVIDEHGLSESQIERALLLQTNDSGLITLLVSFGLLGVFWVLAKLIILFKLFSESKGIDRDERSIIIAILAFISTVWLTCTTTYGFTYPDGIVSLALSLFVMTYCMRNST